MALRVAARQLARSSDARQRVLGARFCLRRLLGGERHRPTQEQSSSLRQLRRDGDVKRHLGLAIVIAALALGTTGFRSSASSAGTRATETTREIGAKVRVPNVVGFRMDRATRTLRDRGLRVNEECSGLFGCIVKSRWWVCHQSPRGDRYLSRYSVVVIYAERRGEC